MVSDQIWLLGSWKLAANVCACASYRILYVAAAGSMRRARGLRVSLGPTQTESAGSHHERVTLFFASYASALNDVVAVLIDFRSISKFEFTTLTDM